MESSAGISTNLIPMSKTTFGTYHYSVRIGRGKTTFPTVALGSLHGSLAFFGKGRGVQSPWLAISQTYLSALFSCQRALAKACCFHVKAGAEQERGD